MRPDIRNIDLMATLRERNCKESHCARESIKNKQILCFRLVSALYHIVQAPDQAEQAPQTRIVVIWFAIVWKTLQQVNELARTFAVGVIT